jgi:hypothetical protein
MNRIRRNHIVNNCENGLMTWALTFRNPKIVLLLILFDKALQAEIQ